MTFERNVSCVCVCMYVCMCERSLYGRGSIKSIRTNYVLTIALKLKPWFNDESQMLNLDNECKNFKWKLEYFVVVTRS